jgi:hypothetical protein
MERQHVFWSGGITFLNIISMYFRLQMAEISLTSCKYDIGEKNVNTYISNMHAFTFIFPVA